MLYTVCKKCDVIVKGANNRCSCRARNSSSFQSSGFNVSVATRNSNQSFLPLTLIVIVTAVLIGLLVSRGDAMEVCQQTHSYDVCFSTLNN